MITLTEENMFPTEDLILAVKRGASFLDEAIPSWAEKINLDSLRMSKCKACIVGQALGEYHSGLAEITGLEMYSGEADAWAREHGFNVPEYRARTWEDDCETARQLFGDLETVWTKAVNERRNND